MVSNWKNAVVSQFVCFYIVYKKVFTHFNSSVDVGVFDTDTWEKSVNVKQIDLNSYDNQAVGDITCRFITENHQSQILFI